MLISAFALLQFKNILVIIMNISTKSVPGWSQGMLLTVKTAISEAFVISLHFTFMFYVFVISDLGIHGSINQKCLKY